MRDTRARRARRRGALWALFALAGLALGTVHASGFATAGGSTGIAGAGSPLGQSPGENADTAALSSLIRSQGDLRWTWRGEWGSVADRSIFTVDLDEQPVQESFAATVMLMNEPRGFSALQLQLRIADAGRGADCDAADMNAGAALDPANQRVLATERADAQVTFAGMGGARSGLRGGTTYCVGVADYPGAGHDPNGTFVRAAGAAFDGTYPTLVATLNGIS